MRRAYAGTGLEEQDIASALLRLPPLADRFAAPLDVGRTDRFVRGTRNAQLRLERFAKTLGIALIDEPLVAAEALGHEREHVLSELSARGHQLVRCDDAVGETPFDRLRGAQEVTGQRQFLRPINADRT